MRFRIAILLISITIIGIALFNIDILADSPPPAVSSKHKGVSWVGGPKITSEDLKSVTQVEANWIMLIPFGWQRYHYSNQVHLATENNYYWGESDEGIRTTTRLAKEKGLKVLLKPHIWLLHGSDEGWRVTIEMQSEADWKNWFRTYEEFILHYAIMAERDKIEAFCVGTELHSTVLLQEDRWRSLIEKVREVYSGEIIYAANWYREFEEIQLWDAVDYIGIQAYFPLTEEENPSKEELIKGWKPHLKKIKQVSDKYKKPVLFTEVGYKSTSDCAIEPWVWPTSENSAKRVLSIEAQKKSYEAMFESFWDQPWFAGTYIWDWYPNHEQAGGLRDKSFTPQNKPAEEIIRKYYSGLD